ncbi:helix-turn-helix domain-containing protein [Nocardiopsis sp. MG754419]|uniref:helix-turn-helix domain-containing protein n=1 Tax=Nocardiopsis sp. MG754419 TaxID=2259865 RepID=UPI001BA49B56|nr:helix-turn-helix domain-containing protein [Nocardiopsis sp. MG754419]MBR8744749.1 AraC family transcriptional regulator [Nocardiopsis sp. MG754419]
MTDPTSAAPSGRDRLRELLDAVLAEDNTRLSDMAGQAHASPFHFSRTFARDTGESPVALRRRVLLERAAWQIGQGTGVTDAAFLAGYASVEGFTRAFARAFGHPPSATTEGSERWLPAPNGVHFHPPFHLWVEEHPRGRPGMDLTAFQVHHDVDDTARLIEVAAGLPEEEYRKVRSPGRTVLGWDGPEESIAQTLDHLVWSKEVWLASIEGADFPDRGGEDPASLRTRHREVGARWIATVGDIGRRGAWGDRLIDALCDPPESFVLGSVVVHVLTFAAHRRQLVRHMVREAGVEMDHGDPIEWLQDRYGGTT